MSYAAYDSRYPPTSRHDGYSREHDAAPRRAAANMTPWPTSSYDTYRSYDTYSRYDARAPSPPRRTARRRAWPPPPSVEDEPAPRWGADEGEPPLNTRGTVDQDSLLDEIADDRRFVLVSHPAAEDGLRPRAENVRDRRRKSVAERGHMAPIQTSLEEPPVFTERVSTPYAYTRPQRESTAPSPTRPAWDSQRDQNARPSRNPAFDDSDLEPEDTTKLRAARQPARYSFVKSDFQKEDLRTNLRDTQPKPESRPPPLPTERSSASAKDSAYAQSPRSSTSSLNTGNPKSRPAPSDLPHSTSSRTPSRPSSPPQRAPSPRLPTRLRGSPSSSRPSSRGNTRPASPVSLATVQPSSSSRVHIVDADRHSTYPPPTASDRSRPTSRYGRYETMPSPAPRIDIKSPSPARPPPNTSSALPYPIDDHPIHAAMPLEEHYQFDHSTLTSPRQSYPDSPRVSSSIPASPRVRETTYYPSRQNATLTEDLPSTQRARSSSLRSQSSQDSRWDQLTKKNLALDLEKPLPSCPRKEQLGLFDDWYSLEGSQNFDICPSCYEGIFLGTPFATQFSQTRRYERPVERYCDFSNPWMRLAWVLTVQQRRQTLSLFHTLANITDSDQACPEDRVLGTDRVAWYGILDQRDGLPVANFAICSCDKNRIENLFPTMRGYFTKLSSSYQTSGSDRYLCSLRESSRRSPKYVDLLMNLDAEALSLGQRPNMTRFIQLVRENAFKGECAKDKLSVRKPWHFIPALPEFTVCEECYDALIWPATQPKSSSSVSPAIPRLLNKTIQLVPGEDPDIGSSCCLYSPRMRRVWETSVMEEDLTYLKRKAIERKKAEMRLARERKGLMNWMASLERGGSEWERARSELKEVEREWAVWK